MQGLHVLNLSRNRVGDKAAAELATGNCLQTLALAGSGLGADLALFSTALQENNHLFELVRVCVPTCLRCHV